MALGQDIEERHTNRCAACCQDLDINPLHLLIPALMGPDGQAFVLAHGLDTARLHELQEGLTALPNGWVKIQHRCAQLTDDGACAIYESRPRICRDFQCVSRTDCTLEA